MNRTTAIFLATTFLAATAFAKDKNPADYPLTAHVIAANGATSTFTTEAWTVKFQIGNLVYSCGSGCRRHVQVGGEVRARVEKRRLHILSEDGETCTTEIRGVQEK